MDNCVSIKFLVVCIFLELNIVFERVAYNLSMQTFLIRYISFDRLKIYMVWLKLQDINKIETNNRCVWEGAVAQLAKRKGPKTVVPQRFRVRAPLTILQPLQRFLEKKKKKKIDVFEKSNFKLKVISQDSGTVCHLWSNTEIKAD